MLLQCLGRPTDPHSLQLYMITRDQRSHEYANCTGGLSMPRGVSNIYDLVMAATGFEPFARRCLFSGGGGGGRCEMPDLRCSNAGPLNIESGYQTESAKTSLLLF